LTPESISVHMYIHQFKQCLSVFLTWSSPYFARRTRPAHVPIIGIPECAAFFISSAMPSFLRSLPSVVLFPARKDQGITGINQTSVLIFIISAVRLIFPNAFSNALNVPRHSLYCDDSYTHASYSLFQDINCSLNMDVSIYVDDYVMIQ